MNFLAPLVLYSWFPIVMLIFAMRAVRDAVVFSFVFAWLFLPNIGFSIPGFPNYTKMTATVVGVILSAVVFDASRVMAFRPKWYDMPAVIFCGCRFVSSLLNNQGSYDGFSAVVEQTFYWGLPFLIGRVYLSDLEGARKLCKAIVIGGLVYVPFCLIEIRLSPRIAGWVYGTFRWEGLRDGGYRPRVFLATGLELGMWMAITTLLAWVLMMSGTIKILAGYSFRMLTIGLTVVNFLCRSAGASALLVVGVALTWMVQRTRKPWPIILLLLLPPGYAVSRMSGLWSGREAVDFAKMTFGPERAQSLEYRFECEDVLFNYTRNRFYFGYSRNNGFNYSESKRRQDVIIDGYWIIIFGDSGCVGLVSFMGIMMLPMVLTIRRFPARTWNDPDVAPVFGLSLMLALYMIDCLSNAMPNPIYGLASGAVMGTSSSGRVGLERLAELSLSKARELFESGHLDEAEAEYRRVAELSSNPEADPEAQHDHAVAFEGLTLVFRATDRLLDAEFTSREALADRLALASEMPDLDQIQALALAHENLARTLTDLGRSAEAIAERRKSLELWTTLAAEMRGVASIRERRAASLNDLAWQLASETNPKLRNPLEAVELAAEAIRVAPESLAFWNTLGVARYRLGDWSGAVEALEHSVEVGPAGGTAFDHFFLAMACHQLGQASLAHDWYRRGIAWSDRHRAGHPTLASFRTEAESLLDPDNHRLKELS